MAQPKLRHEEMYVGAQGGALASMVSFSPTVSQHALHSYLGGTAGVVFRYVGHKVCGLQIEANWMQKGWNEYTPQSDGSKAVTYSRRLDYLQVPLLCHLYFGKKARGFINLGPQIGILLYDKPICSTSSPEYLLWENTNNSRDGKQYAKVENKFDWGVAGGLGFYYRTPKAGTYQIEARFNYSLGAYFDTSKMAYFSTSNAMNLSLTMAYMWQLKGDK